MVAVLKQLPMNKELQNQILERADKISDQRKLCDRFVIAMAALLKLSPNQFQDLEGLTKEGGQIVFISSDKRKIENSAPASNPIKLPNGGWYVNASGGVKDFELILDLSRQRLGLPVGFVEELKRKTILRPEVDFI